MQRLFENGIVTEPLANQPVIDPASSPVHGIVAAHVSTVAVISADAKHRQAITLAFAGSTAGIPREFTAYPELDDVPGLLQQEFDVVIVDLDGNPEHALDLVESLCAAGSITVMVYSERTDSEMLVRCMRVGAREYLTEPLTQEIMEAAMVRASVRKPVARPVRKGAGKLVVFVGAKGGSGTTTIATNFAVSLARESGKSTVLIDLDLPLGQTALELGINPQFSTVNALENFQRLDTHFLSTLLTKHSSGVHLLAAPDRYGLFQTPPDALARLTAVSRQSFDFVVVDAGSTMGPGMQLLFNEAATVYLVTQVGIADLRNANRMITEYFKGDSDKLQIVLNRFTPRSLGIDEEHVTKALTKPADWKVPGDYVAARQAQNTATPMVLQDSPISRVLKQMARKACDLPSVAKKKNRLSLFGS